jgi:methionine salvage enolase-phosphatase E1
MSKLEELMQQQAALAEEIKLVAKDEKAEALKEVRRLCKLHGFTHNQCFKLIFLLDVHA